MSIHTPDGREPIAILAYHQTAAQPPRGTPHRDLVLPPADFARQVKALRALGYQGLSLRELGPFLRGQRRGKVVGITLDDGYLGNLEHALPVLREAGFTATSFAVPGHLGGSNAWDHVHGVAPQRLMDRAQLRQWLDAGMEVGAHTVHHVDLTACDPATAREEIAGARARLEDALGVAVASFCYPYGRLRDEHVELVREAGYRQATTCESHRAVAGGDPLRLPRITVRTGTPLPFLLAQVATAWEDRRAALRHWRRARRAGGLPTAGTVG